MLSFERGFIDFNNQMNDAINQDEDKYHELCIAFNECKCLIDDIDKYLDEIIHYIDQYYYYEQSVIDYDMNGDEYYKKALESKVMVERCLKELSDYGFKVEGYPEYDGRLIKIIKEKENE